MDTQTTPRRLDVTLACWDGEHRFRLGIKELITLGEKLEEGPLVTLNRLMNETWRLKDIRETIRLGLIGAGINQGEALRLVEQNVDRLPWTDSVPIARSILIAAMYGVEDVEPKAEAAEVSTDG